MNRDQAVVDLVEARGHALKRYAALLCGNAADAEDLVQDALVSVLGRYRRVPVEHLEAYTRKIIMNRFLDHERRRRRGELLTPRHGDTQHRDVEDDVLVQVTVHTALRGLPPRQRACIVLRYYLDYSLAEIADCLACSQGSVKRNLHDARKSLESGWGARFPASG